MREVGRREEKKQRQTAAAKRREIRESVCEREKERETRERR